MPIKPENRKRYPKNWDDISKEIRTGRAGNKCEACGIRNYSIIKRLKHGKWRSLSQQEWDMVHSRIRNWHTSMAESLKYYGFTKIVLTVGHLDHTPENNNPENLKAMCQYCHNKYDMKQRILNRNKKYINKNQIELF